MNYVNINVGEIKNSCFVVMPFSSLFQTEYDKIILPALNELNIECIRGDEIYSKQRIMDDIWNSIRNCRFVLAELTGKNPNVLYEIGLAHAIGKPVIIITRNGDDVPFDLKALRYLYYDVNDPFWGENLKNGIKNLVVKLLENPQIDNYLEGIDLSKVKYKKPDFSKKIKIETPILDFDISGTWIGHFIDIEKVAHKITLQLSQKGEELFGSAVLTYKIDNVESVVQQMMNGKANSDKKVELTGVNYTYIQRGNTHDYALDNFSLIYNPKRNELKGVVINNHPMQKYELDITFTEINES